MKYEWRKKDKRLYLPKTTPEIVELEPYTYITLKGKGNPNSEEFSEDIGALYALAYTIKMNLKAKTEFYDYTVFPLEGIWDLSEEGKALSSKNVPITELKDYFEYTLMLRHPDYITEEIFDYYRQLAAEKKKNPHILDITYYKSSKKLVCQCMHLGSYDLEQETFQKMIEYTTENGYVRFEKVHTEIYISDARKTVPEKLKTILRFTVKQKQ